MCYIINEYIINGGFCVNMELSDALEKVLKAYSRFYDIETDSKLCSGFSATANYRVKNDNYILSRKNVISSYEQYEYVYFLTEKNIDAIAMKDWIDKSLSVGMLRISPNKYHMSSKITLIILSNSIEPEAKKLLCKTKHHKCFKLYFHGWMEYKISAVEMDTMSFYSNSAGKDILETFKKTLQY